MFLPEGVPSDNDKQTFFGEHTNQAGKSVKGQLVQKGSRALRGCSEDGGYGMEASGEPAEAGAAAARPETEVAAWAQ